MGFAVIAAAAALLHASFGAEPNPVERENGLPGTQAWAIGGARSQDVEAYLSETDVLPGQAVHIHVSTRERYRIMVYRLGWYGGSGGRLVACAQADCISDEQGSVYSVPSPEPGTYRVVAGWPVTDSIQIPADAVSGYYLAQVVLTTGSAHGRAATVPFVVRPPEAQRSAVLVQVPVNTWEAYNAWGGHSLYDVNSVNKQRANHVSFDRPYTVSARALLNLEIPLVRFLEREHVDVSYQTDVDTDLSPSSLLAHRLVITSGHDEYWTKQMRDAFDRARDLGTNLAFMSSNTGYWQVRYEDGGRTIVGYKDANLDPITDPALKTVKFRDLGRPECELEGVMFFYLHGLRETPINYTVTGAASRDSWFAQTGFQPGDLVKAVVNDEWDAVPANPPPSCVKPGLSVLFHYDGTPDQNQDADAVRYTAPSGARVFSGGAEKFSWALDTWGIDDYGDHEPADPRLQQFARNMLDDLTRPAPPRSYDIRVSQDGVHVRFARGIDPRIDGIEIFRQERNRLALVARSKTGFFTDHPPRRDRVVRYLGISVDRWGTSRPLPSKPVRLRRAFRVHS
jgi:hypothetical protein